MASRQPFSKVDYHNDLRRRLKSGVIRAAGRALRPVGVDIELAHYYSPIPRATDRPRSWWEQPSELPGIALDLPGQLSFIETELAGFLGEFSPPRNSSDEYTYHLDNGLFQGGDADLLYAMVRRFKPRRVLELGAGFSTLVSAMGASRNRADGHHTELVTYDPFALAPAPGAVPGLTELRPVSAQDVPLGDFERLAANDILFIDSSHTVKVGGDAIHLITEVLPRLAPGVIVHLHDIYLPWPYPREWVARNRWYWAEQFLLQALLIENDGWGVLVTAHALARLHRTRFDRLIPNAAGSAPPLSFWMRRREAATPR